jgi:hypothetical protein
MMAAPWRKARSAVPSRAGRNAPRLVSGKAWRPGGAESSRELPDRTAIDLAFDLAGMLTLARGELWLTRAGDPVDYCLRAGEGLLLAPGAYVAFAVGACRLEWLPACRPCLAKGGFRTCPA